MASFPSNVLSNNDVKPLPHLEATGASGPGANVSALVAASQVVEQKLLDDEQNEQEKSLSNLLSKHDSSPYFVLPFEKSANSNNSQINGQAWSSYKASPFAVNERRKFDVWPHEIQQQLHYVKRKPSCGLFPEINCAWITLDNRLYLWNYENNLPLTRYDKLDHIIVSVGLVRPRRGVFKEFVKYILVIATTVEIVLVGVVFEENNLQKRIQLKPTSFFVSADNIFVLKIIGTAIGRIFVGGNDGSIYEIDYDGEGSWRSYLGLPNKCQKINRSSKSIATWLVPQFVKDMFSAEDPIHDIVIDNSRNILYSLSKKNVISVFDLGDDGETFLYIHQQDVANMCMRHIQSGSQDQNLKDYYRRTVAKTEKYVISLHVIEKDDNRTMRLSGVEMEQVHLIALCQDGIRLYLTTAKKSKSRNYNNQAGYGNAGGKVVKNTETGPKTLSLLRGTHCIRAAPASYQPQKMSDDIFRIGIGQRYHVVSNGQPRPYVVSTGYCDRNVCIMAEGETGRVGVESTSDSITAFCSDTAHQLFGSSKTRDPFVASKLFNAQNQGRGSRNNALSVYNKELSLKESVHHLDPKAQQEVPNEIMIGRVYEIAMSERPKTLIDYHMYTARPLKARQSSTNNNIDRAGGMSSSFQSHNIGGKRSFSDISSTNGRNKSKSTFYELEYVRLGVLATQHRNFVQNILCLTTNGLYRFEVLKPVEQLRRLLRISDRQSFKVQVEKFRNLYGRSETCAMALILICSLPELTDETGTDIPFDSYAPGIPGDAALGQTNFTGKNAITAANLVVDRAKQIFFQNTWSGVPSDINSNGSMINDAYGYKAGKFSMNQIRGITFSGRREGIALYLSRLLRPFWDHSVVYQNSSYAPVRYGIMGYVDRFLNSARTLTTGRNGLYILRFDRILLGELFRPIERLRKFMEKHSTNGNNRNGYSLDCKELSSYTSNNHDHATSANNSSYTGNEGKTNVETIPMDPEVIESRSLAELYHLTTRCSQALEALRILAAPQHNFPRLVSSGIRRSERQRNTTTTNNMPYEKTTRNDYDSDASSSSLTLLSAKSLEDLTFRNLITDERSGKVITALLFELMCSLSFDTSNVQELCRDLQSRCPMFFSSFTGKLVVGNVYLKRAISHGNRRPRERQDLLDAALEEYVRATEELEKFPDPHSVNIIEDACDKFESLKFYDGVLVLMLSAAHHVAQGRTKNVVENWESIKGNIVENNPSNSNGINPMNTIYGNINMGNNNGSRYSNNNGYNTAHVSMSDGYRSPNATCENGMNRNVGAENEGNKRLNLRKRMYNRVIRVMDNLIFPQNNEDNWSDENRERYNTETYEQNISEFLNRAQQYEDACFHNDLYSYLLLRNENSRYERLPSRHVETFLHRMIEKTAYTGQGPASEANKYYDSLSNYYIKNNRLKAAANFLVKRAKWDEIDLEKNPQLDSRLSWLNEAIRLLNSSRIAYGAPGIDDDVIDETVESLEGDRDVAMEQKMLFEAIQNLYGNNGNKQNNNDFQKDWRKFTYTLIDVSTLYKIAKRYRLWENCLSIIFCCDQRDDKIYRSIQSCWRQLIESSLKQTAGRTYLSHLNNRAVWVEAVMKTITSTGKRFYGKGRDFVVPVDYIVALMEGLLMESGEDVVEANGVLFSDYVPQCLKEIGVPWLDIINAYEKTVDDPDDVRNAVDTMVVSQGEQVLRRGIGSNTRKLHCLIMLEHILRMWMEHVDDLQAPDEMEELIQNEPILNDMIMRWRAATGGLLNLPQLYEENDLKGELMKLFEDLLVNYLPSLRQQRLQDM